MLPLGIWEEGGEHGVALVVPWYAVLSGAPPHLSPDMYTLSLGDPDHFLPGKTLF